MGTNTPHLNLYKPEGSELVDVVEQINENYDKLDSAVFNVDNRVGALEGFAGFDTSWDTYTPTVKINAGATTFTTSIQHAEYFVAGEVVSLDVQVTILNATATYNGSPNPINFDLSLPFKAKRQFMTGALKFLPPSGSGHLGKYFFPTFSNASSGDGFTLSFAPLIDDGTDFNITYDSTVNLTVPINTILRFSATYRTDGTAA